MEVLCWKLQRSARTWAELARVEDQVTKGAEWFLRWRLWWSTAACWRAAGRGAPVGVSPGGKVPLVERVAVVVVRDEVVEVVVGLIEVVVDLVVVVVGLEEVVLDLVEVVLDFVVDVLGLVKKVGDWLEVVE